MSKRISILSAIAAFLCAVTLFSCKKEVVLIPPATTPYIPPVIRNFRSLPENPDNPMTLEGIALGKRLFFDPILSLDSTISCSSCHKKENSFSDPSVRSSGVGGTLGKRHSIALINLAWQKDRFFWDGRAASLQEQAKMPIEDPLEMHLPITQAVQRLQRQPGYIDLFWKAFGTKTVSEGLVTKALEQFERSLISYNTRFDRYLRSEGTLSDAELRGLQIFTTEKGDCFHCHSTAAPEVFISPDRTFANNGLDSVSAANDFVDLGLGKFTGNPSDNGRFKIPALRNLAFSNPYMHDGRFATLDEVIDFYNEGPKGSPTLEPIMREKANKRVETTGFWGLNLSTQDKADLKAFLLSFTDSSFVE
ncbi:MAG: cytochrome-c peroxidase [Sphingobacteriales bacterium]|nr:cytochrome-c peroxidase [Sphingobacteriales bacterium]